MRYFEQPGDWRVGVLACAGLTALLTGVLALFASDLALVNQVLIFLLLTLAISAIWGVKVGIFAAVVTNLALNYFFVEPLHRFSVDSSGRVVDLAVFLAVSIVAGSLVSATRAAAEQARYRQAESAVLLKLSQDLIGQSEPEAALGALCEHVVTTYVARGASVLSVEGESWTVLARAGDETSGRLPNPDEISLANRVLSTGISEGLGAPALVQARRPRIVQTGSRSERLRRQDSVTFIQLRLADRAIGVLRLDGPFGETPFLRQPEALLGAFAQEAALAVQRVELARAAAAGDVWKQADEMKSTLMASISHDLKTPLAAIKTSVSGLLYASIDWNEGDKRAFLETIESQADRLDRVISDILDLNRIRSGVFSCEMRPVFVADLLEEARDAALGAIAGRTVQLTADESLVVHADGTLIRHALVNLLENAAKYSPTDTSISLEAEVFGSSVVIKVSDHGPGIARSDQENVFNPFYRGTEARTHPEGSGLGLAIVKAFVELSRGEIEVESSAMGTSFIIKLPMVANSVPATA